jgi:hypothetical protein
MASSSDGWRLALVLLSRHPRFGYSAGGHHPEADGKPWRGARGAENPADWAANQIADRNSSPPRSDHEVGRYPLADATISKPARLVTVSK